MSGRSIVALIFAAGSLVALLARHNQVESVVVDGKRSGPSALRHQSHQDEMIDGFNTKTCGIYDQDDQKSGFVNAAREGQFPWLVSFQVRRDFNQVAHFCMGSFISNRWVMSAAHCFADPIVKKLLQEDRIRVTAGSKNAYNSENQNFTIKRIFYHEKFDRSSPIGFDIALVELNEKAEVRTSYNDKLPFINTICLPVEGKEFKPGQAVKIAGWGDTESKDPKSKPDSLLTTDLVLVNASKCADIFSQKLKKVKKQYHDFKDFVCADYHGQRDACQGDSGAPLLEYADDKAVAVGIVSYGIGCATKGVPGVYERVSSLMPWIKDITMNKENATVEYHVLSKG